MPTWVGPTLGDKFLAAAQQVCHQVRSVMEISTETLSRWASECMHMNHLGTLVTRSLAAGDESGAAEFAERARVRAWKLLNELFTAGAEKPAGYAEPSAPTG